jgi:cellulose synthase/poly-beta-1,6-N-acetylglucosamine synthase-like glycosyltransferase
MPVILTTVVASRGFGRAGPGYRLDMLAALLLAGVVAAPLCSAALFVAVHRPRSVAGVWPAARRLVLAVLATLVVGAVVAEVLRVLAVTPSHTAVAVGLFAAASMAWLPATRRWNARAHLAWVSTVFLFVAYLVFILLWTVTSGLGVWGTLGGLLLWAFELVAALMACAYLWELCDALGTEHWRRRATLHDGGGPFPFVSLHVPAHNEPPEMVIETLRSLLCIDYPRYEVVVIDDNTEDEATWQPVRDWCAEHGVTFAHLADWPGYKSGALNYALGECAHPDTEIIGVVDSDYQIDPEFLRHCVPLFADASVGFIQAPQDYRDWRASAYLRRLYYSYRYFFAVSQPSRNERDGAIFAGTMGLIRKDALVQVGGWDEWCITEDAELSLRLLRAGWSGLHVDASMGRGVMPLTFEALKSQRYRWCFGGIQILRMHLPALLPGRRTVHNRLSAGQRWAYLSGALQWYGDLLGLVFFAFLLTGAVNLMLGGGQLFRSLSAFLVATVPALIALGLVRAVALLRRGTGATWRDAIGAFFIWQSTSLVVARASLQGLYAKRAEFLRTPKTGEQATVFQVIRANWAETLLAVLGVFGIVGALTRVDTYGGPLLAALLVVPTLGMAAAPFNSLAAQRSMLPPELAARRRSEWLRDRQRIVAGTTAGMASVAAVVLVAVIATLLTAPTPAPVRPPRLLRPDAPTTAPSPTAPGPAPSVVPSVAPSTSAPSSQPVPSGPVPSSAPVTPPPATPTPSVSVPVPTRS